jgi:xanthine/uracil/vitamin C permease (AzgA family)
MMMRGVLAINWNYPGDSIPAFVTLMFMPFSYSIAYGLIAGIMCYTIINGSTWAIGKISRGRLLPPDYDNKEYWSCESLFLVNMVFENWLILLDSQCRNCSSAALVHPDGQRRQEVLEA